MFFLRLCRPTLLDQIEGLPEQYAEEPAVPDPVMAIAEVDRLIAAENGGAIFDHGSGGIVLLRAA